MAGRDKFVEQDDAIAEAGIASVLRTHAQGMELRLMAGVGLAGAVLVLGFSRLSGVGVLAALALLAAAVVLGVRLAARSRAWREALLERQEAAVRRTRDLYARLFPVWARQIATCRETADDSVAQLARNFSEMVERLDATLSASKRATTGMGAGERGIVAAIGRGETDLAGVVAMLKDLQRDKDAIVRQVAEYATHLKEMGADVQQIAMQIRLLSLNGAIEAARAGEAGRAFAVVVGEMRRLSSQSSEVGARISKKVEVVNGALAQLYRDREANAEQDGASIGRAEQDVGRVIASFKDLTEGLSRSVSAMERESGALKEQIADALVALQFQDRVSQIMAHTAQHLGEAGSVAARGEELQTDAEAWLAEMSRAFTTHEEFENLSGAGRAKRVAHEVKFF